ncbi:MAG: tetratricopeptide repeat protein, partial [Pyrinomonadaceae bacterium]
MRKVASTTLLLLSLVISTAAQTATEFFNRGNDLFQKADYTNAISDYSRAIATDPTYIEAYRRRGIARLQVKNYAGGITDMEKVLELRPGNA